MRAYIAKRINFSISVEPPAAIMIPVPLRVYDETIRVMKCAVQKAKLGHREKLSAIKQLDIEARKLERAARGPSLASFVASESHMSPLFDGRSVFGWEGQQKKLRNP
jgi:hypothetical protein